MVRGPMIAEETAGWRVALCGDRSLRCGKHRCAVRRQQAGTQPGPDFVSGVGTQYAGLLQGYTSVISGGQAASPYLGGRVAVSLLLGRAHRFLLGLWFI